MPSLDDIRLFLERRRIAIVGVSHDPRDFSRTLLAEFRRRGYDVAAVNPAVVEVDGMRCFPNVESVSPPAEAALLMTSSAVTPGVVKDCERAGIRRIWMYRAGGKGAVNPEAVSFCHANGMAVVDGACPFMFFPRTGAIHRIHGFCQKIVGRYPK